VATTAEQDICSEEELYLLKYGRHLRLDKNTKIVVGRTKKDNEKIKGYYNPAMDILIKVKNFPGPTVLMPQGGRKEIIVFAAAICAGYSKAPVSTQVEALIIEQRKTKTITVSGINPAEIRNYLI